MKKIFALIIGVCCFWNVAFATEVQLDVPYYWQSSAKWCWAASASMLAKYYNQLPQSNSQMKPWWCAAELDKPSDDSAGDPGGNIFATMDVLGRMDSVHNYSWITYVGLNAAMEAHIKNKISEGHPVLFKSWDNDHDIIITGFSDIDDTVIVNDPSGALFSDGEKLCHIEESWASFWDKIDSEWLSGDAALVDCDSGSKAIGSISFDFCPEHYWFDDNDNLIQVVYPGLSHLWEGNFGPEWIKLKWGGMFDEDGYVGYEYDSSNGLTPDGASRDSDGFYDVPYYGYMFSYADVISLRPFATCYGAQDTSVRFDISIINNETTAWSSYQTGITIPGYSHMSDELIKSIPVSAFFNDLTTNECKLLVVCKDASSGVEQDRVELGFRVDLSKPGLGDGSVSPVSGDNGDTFSFSVDYLDRDGSAPSSAKVYIDDSSYTMTRISGTSANGTYRYQTSSLITGDHNYYFQFTNTDGETVRLPASGTFKGPAVALSATLTTPSVSPSAGSAGDTYTYSVDYSDTSGIAPLEKKIYIDGVAFNMTLESGSPSNGTYKYSKNGLSAGVHNYRYSFKAGSGQPLVSPTSGNHSGPTVNEDPDPDGRVKISVFWGSDSPGENGQGGYVHPNVSWDQTFAPGQSQWFTAYPAFGWELDHWKIRYIWSLSPGSAYYYAPDGTSANSAMMITRDVERDANNWAENAIYCTFQRVHTDNRILTVSAVGPGSVDPGAGQYERGLTDDITVTATPSADTAFVKWLLDGTEVCSATSYTFNMGSQDHSVEAVFQYNQTAIYTLELPCIADASIRIEDFGEDGDHYGYGSESRVGFKVYPDRRNYTWDTAMKFDVILVPADAIIQDVYLRLYCIDVPNRGGIGYEVQKNTSAWDEDTIQSAQPTCLNPVNYNGNGLFNGGENQHHDLHVSDRIAAAVDWVSEWRSNNYGLRVRPSQYHVDDETSYEGYYDFATRHVADTSRWPVLRVTYEGRRLVPQISTSPGSIEVTVVRGDAASVETFTVWNSGEGTLNYTATTEAPWIQLSGETEGSSDEEAHQVNVGFDPSSLPLGYHDGSIVISDLEAENSPITIPVTLDILGPVISHDPPMLSTIVEAGYNAEGSMISVWNSGQGALHYSVSKSASWLQLSSTSGQSSGNVEQVNVQFDTDILDPGTYNDTIYISDQNGDAATKEIPVEVTVLGRVAMPVLIPSGGTIGQNEISIEMTCSTPGSEIRYTLDGSEPVSTSSLYSGDPLNLLDTSFVRAMAYHPGMLQSGETSGMYIVNHDPTALALSNSSIPEHEPEDTIVGSFSTTDQDIGNTFTYSLVSGVGDTDNDAFTISGDSLKTAVKFDYELKSSFSIRVRTTDQSSLWYEDVFTILILDIDDKGDVNIDGSVDINDAIIVLNILSGIQPNIPINKFADVDGDGKIGMPEALFILQKTAAIAE